MPRIFSAGNRSSTAGVTLMEMMAVVAIIGIIIAVSAPSLSAGIDSVRMAAATDSVAGFLNAAVNRAERRQQPIEIEIRQKENRLMLYSNEPGYTRELRLPDGILIEGTFPPDTERLILMPGASVPGLGIQLANRRGGRRIVRLDPMTGFPRVESVKPQ